MIRHPYPWDIHLPGWSASVMLVDNCDVYGRCDATRRQIIIFTDGERSLADMAQTLGHELGHAVDWERLTPDHRRWWRRNRQLKRWQTEGDGPDWNNGDGDFAESFSWVYRLNNRVRIRVPKPTAEQERFIRAVST